ncbi:hypothetical protein WJX72_011020 [[Myrmecia] bisecta]|uniref:non-specific serine/threonine protein kinase n=1 Tax=[Myrmecia] bisecta TaxID=41462 RepID=A0AAW1R8J0_9CHLO
MQEELFQDFTVSTPWERCVADIEAALNSWKLIGLSELSKRPPAVVSGSRLPSLVKIQAVVQHKLQHRAEPYVLTLHLPHISANQTAKVKPTPPHAPALLWTASDSTAAADISWPGGSAAGWETQEGLHKLQRWFGVALFITLAPASYSRRILDEQEASSLLSALAVALSSTQVSWPAFLPVHDPYRDACWGIAVCGPSSTHFNSDSVRTSTLPERLLEVDGQLTLFSQQLAPHAPLAAAACLAAASDAGIASLASAAAGQPPAAYGPDVRVSVRKTYILPEQRNGGAEDSSQLEDPTTLWLDEWDEASSWRPWAAHADPLADLELDLDVLWTAVPAEAAVQEDCLNRNNATSWQLHALHAQTEAPAASGIFGSQASQPTRQHLRLPSSPDSSTSSFNIGLGASIAQPVELDGDEESDGSFTAMLTALARSRQAAVQARAIGQLAAPGWWAGQDVLVPPPAPPESVLQDVLRDLFQAPDLPSLFSRGFVALAEGSRGTAGGSATPPLLPALPGTTPCDSLLASLSLHALVFGNARAVAILWGRFGLRELPRGVAKTLEGVSLLAAPHTLLNVPLTQEAPVWTEDMLWEREATMSALGDSEVAHALRKRLQGDILTSDIAAFKAANPGCVLEDFVRWHSPRDWVPDAAMPGGGRLSERMSHQGGLWRQLWEQTAARPAAEQKPLMDPELEGERVLHYLETLPPAAIWDQLLAVGLSTTLHLLGQSVGAQLPAAAQALHRFHKQASRVLQSPPCQPIYLDRVDTWESGGSPGTAQTASQRHASASASNFRIKSEGNQLTDLVADVKASNQGMLGKFGGDAQPNGAKPGLAQMRRNRLSFAHAMGTQRSSSADNLESQGSAEGSAASTASTGASSLSATRFRTASKSETAVTPDAVSIQRRRAGSMFEQGSATASSEHFTKPSFQRDAVDDETGADEGLFFRSSSVAGPSHAFGSMYMPKAYQRNRSASVPDLAQPSGTNRNAEYMPAVVSLNGITSEPSRDMGSLTGWQALANEVMEEMADDPQDLQASAASPADYQAPPAWAPPTRPPDDHRAMESTMPHVEAKAGGTFYVLYELQDELGEGAFGKAVRARRRKDGQMLVVKIMQKMTDKARDEARNEVKVLASLDHPNIVKYYECYAERNNMMHIVMELCDDGDLDSYIKKRNGNLISEHEIMLKFVQICLALLHVHSKGIIHRDLKANNIFCCAHGIVKLGDFGISRKLTADQACARTMVGTPYYMSPEILKGKPYDAKTDIWAIGCVLYELCSLKKAFDANNLGAITMKIMKASVNPIPAQYSDDLKKLVESLLTKDPDARPKLQDVLELPYVRTHLRNYRKHIQLNVRTRQGSFERSLAQFNLDRTLSAAEAKLAKSLGLEEPSSPKPAKDPAKAASGEKRAKSEEFSCAASSLLDDGIARGAAALLRVQPSSKSSDQLPHGGSLQGAFVDRRTLHTQQSKKRSSLEIRRSTELRNADDVLRPVVSRSEKEIEAEKQAMKAAARAAAEEERKAKRARQEVERKAKRAREELEAREKLRAFQDAIKSKASSRAGSASTSGRNSPSASPTSSPSGSVHSSPSGSVTAQNPRGRSRSRFAPLIGGVGSGREDAEQLEEATSPSGKGMMARFFTRRQSLFSPAGSKTSAQVEDSDSDHDEDEEQVDASLDNLRQRVPSVLVQLQAVLNAPQSARTKPGEAGPGQRGGRLGRRISFHDAAGPGQEEGD